MIIIDGITGALEMVLSGAPATNQLPFTAHWVDVQKSDFSVVGIGHTDGVSSGTAVATIVTGPSSGRTRTIKYVSLFNADTTGAIPTIRYNNGTTTRIILQPTLSVGDTLEYSAED